MDAVSVRPEATAPLAVDMVFTWVDGDDPAHQAERRSFGEAAAVGPAARRGAAPERWYRGVGEITASVRSVVRHLPWVRTIFVVTDGQTPPVDPELIASGRVRVVDHEEIIPDAYRPVFASTVIESFLHRIPGLSEIWLYDNDDLMHFGPAAPATFVRQGQAGGVALRLQAYLGIVRYLLRLGAGMTPPPVPRANPYTEGTANACRILRDRARVPWSEMLVPRHVTQVYRTSTALRLEAELADVLHASRCVRFRTRRQVSWGTLAYTLERRWHPEDEVRLWRPFDRSGELGIFDFLHCRAPGSEEPRWAKVESSRAPLACVNNVPVFERRRFWDAMRRHGLGEPLATTPRAPEPAGGAGVP
jgi:hypothetical protein